MVGAFFKLFQNFNNFFINQYCFFFKESVIFLPISFSLATIPYYHELIDTDKLRSNNIETVAINFGIKFMLFDQLLIDDLKLIIVGLIIISLLIWMDTKSLIFTSMTILVVVMSLVFAYFLYKSILDLKFFPFMNLLAVIVSIGIGVDDAFVYHQIWSLHKQSRQNETVRQILLKTTKHTFILLFSTSLTTSIAFFSLYFNNITAIKCFSIFSGSIVLFNFLLVLLMLPLTLKMSALCDVCSCRSVAHNQQDSKVKFLKYNKKFAICNIVIFFIIIVTSLFVIFVEPKLTLANSIDFQLFDSNNLFEKYDKFYQNKFRFSSNHLNMYHLPLIFVWGILPDDNGDYLDPSQTGHLVFDPNFDMSSKEAQIWFLDFCDDLKTQIFYDQNHFGPQLKNCFLSTFYQWMQNRPCIDQITDEDYRPCCKTEPFPFEQNVFRNCSVRMIQDLHRTPKDFLNPNSIAGPKFFQNNFTINSLIIEYNSNQTYSFSYQEIDNFFHQVENWFQTKLLTAPEYLQNGWFYSDFQFYDLQKVLLDGTFISIAISMCVSLLLLLLLTFNVLVSFFAIISITFSIFLSIAILVLFGWKLNIFEAIAISTAIGLSTDFSLHYSFNFCYFLRQFQDKQMAFRETARHVFRPTIMSGLTTAAIGLFMLPSSILIYKQIGVFLILIMISSWIFGTYFFTSLIILFYPDIKRDFSNCRPIEINTFL